MENFFSIFFLGYKTSFDRGVRRIARSKCRRCPLTPAVKREPSSKKIWVKEIIGEFHHLSSESAGVSLSLVCKLTTFETLGKRKKEFKSFGRSVWC